MLEELRKLQAYQEQELGKQAQILALGLSSRKNLCIHPKISGEGSRENVDAGCRKLTATWVRTVAADNPDIELCDFFEGYEKKGADALLPAGVYTLHDMKVGEPGVLVVKVRCAERCARKNDDMRLCKLLVSHCCCVLSLGQRRISDTQEL